MGVNAEGSTETELLLSDTERQKETGHSNSGEIMLRSVLQNQTEMTSADATRLCLPSSPSDKRSTRRLQSANTEMSTSSVNKSLFRLFLLLLF